MRDAARHCQAMDTLSVFAASLADQMHIGTPPQADAEQQEVTEAFAEIAGRASCAWHLTNCISHVTDAQIFLVIRDILRFHGPTHYP